VATATTGAAGARGTTAPAAATAATTGDTRPARPARPRPNGLGRGGRRELVVLCLEHRPSAWQARQG
jgi:hypothetical protein